MSLKKRLTRKWRKNVMRCAEWFEEEVLNKDDDGTIYPDKRDWGYTVHFSYKGHNVACPDSSWYGSYQGANMVLKWIDSLEKSK